MMPTKAERLRALLDDLESEARVVEDMVAGLTDAQWDRPTTAEGWTVKDQITHLAYLDQEAEKSLRDPARFRAAAAEALARDTNLPDEIADRYHDMEPERALAWFRSARTRLLEAFASSDPSARVAWFGPDMGVMSFATARLMETWAHGHDIAAAINAPHQDTDRLRHVAHLGVQTFGFSFQVHGRAVPTDPVRIDLTAPDGTHWGWGPADARDIVSGPALDFCLVVTRRRKVEETALLVQGRTAAEWMAIAQAFAGRPGPGPARSNRGPGRVNEDKHLQFSHWLPTDAATVRDQTTGDLLRQAASLAPSVTALVEGLADPTSRRKWTYAELLADAETAAGALLARFSPGERIAVWSNNIPEWVLLQMGAALSGLTLVTVDPALRHTEVRHVLEHSRAVGVFLCSEYRTNPMLETLGRLRGQLPDLREVVQFENWTQFMATAPAETVLPAVASDDWAQIQYTSGTTGVPKGVVLTHRGMVNSARLSFEQRLGFQQGEAVVNPMPLFHTAGSGLITLSLIAARGTHVLMPWFDPELYLRLVEEEHSVLFSGVPTMLMAALQHPRFPTTDTSSVQCACSGGAPVPPELVRRVEADLGVPMSVTYAQTEASPAITMTDVTADSAQDRAESVGRPIPMVEVRIADPADPYRTVPVGQVGELCTRGFHVMAGYLDDAEATAQAVDSDGWLHTGDLASMDARGYCRIAGRVKEMIIRGGENIFPREIEEVLIQHPGVRDAAVVGAPDPYWGEQVAAFIAPHAGVELSEDELAEFCQLRLARHKVPRIWRITADFPLTASGKIRKVALGTRLAAELAITDNQ